jgi:hypothetical protein
MEYQLAALVDKIMANAAARDIAGPASEIAFDECTGCA